MQGKNVILIILSILIVLFTYDIVESYYVSHILNIDVQKFIEIRSKPWVYNCEELEPIQNYSRKVRWEMAKRNCSNNTEFELPRIFGYDLYRPPK